MMPKIRIMPNIPRLLVAGLVFGIIPWVVSGYLFHESTVCVSQLQPNDRRSANSANALLGSAKSPPHLLPLDGNAQRLRPVIEPNTLVLTSAMPKPSASSSAKPSESEGDHNFPTERNQGEEPILNTPMLVENSASTRGANVPESASESSYPSTGIPGLPDEFEQTVVPNTIEVILPIVSSPTASPTIESAEPEAASLPPADQLMTLPAPSERTPAAQPSPDLITEPQGSPAAVSTAQPVRSEQLESIAREADRKILHGYELAGRGAYFAARSELIAALRLVAQGLDTERQTTIHGKSLAAGLTALREAEDFLPRGSMVEANLDIAALATSHSTPALKNADNSHTTSLSALKSYLTYAQSEFAAAAGGEIAGSMALRALGKLHDELAKKQTTEVQAAGPKAIVFYQAALLVSPENYLAANDLGVLLARAGNLNDARRILESNAANSRQSTVLHNLAVVYQKIGRNDLAYQANRQSLIAAQMEQNHRQVKGIAASGGIVEWVHPDTFAQTSPNLDSPQSVASKQTTPSQTTGVARPQSATSSTNPFGGNNPHWAPNYQKPAIVGKTTSIDYQR